MTIQWYEYDYGLTFQEGDSGIGGEHGADFLTPLFTPITALLPGTISGIQTGCGFCECITWKLDTPYNGVSHMYNIHLAAIAPGIQVGVHINAGTVIGYSGGATPASIAGDLAATPYNLPPGLSNRLDSSEESGGAHIEVGFTYYDNYGMAPSEVWTASYLDSHPELNPVPFLNQIRAQGPGKEVTIMTTIDLTDHNVARYFSAVSQDQWRCTQTGFTVHDGILAFYRSFGQDAYCGLTHLGLPLSDEIPIDGPPGVVKQQFERGWVCYDPTHAIDDPPGAGDVYIMHLP